MRTKTAVIRDNSERKTLINAVIRRIGLESVMDVVNHGIGGGFSGFIYHSDTCAFYRRHRKAINEWVKDTAEDFGQNCVEFVQGFNCLGDSDWRDEIGACLYGGKLTDDTTQIENALAWFAAEEVCRMFDE
jgi:hypothetical protein